MTLSGSDASFSDPSVFFATEHGCVCRLSDRLFTVSLGEITWNLDVNDLNRLQEATHSLAGDVYRCGTDCRWQLRVPGHSVVVLCSTEVLRLDTLLDGATTLLELDGILADADVTWAEDDVLAGDR
jgi:hypothetical protein